MAEDSTRSGFLNQEPLAVIRDAMEVVQDLAEEDEDQTSASATENPPPKEVCAEIQASDLFKERTNNSMMISSINMCVWGLCLKDYSPEHENFLNAHQENHGIVPEVIPGTNSN